MLNPNTLIYLRIDGDRFKIPVNPPEIETDYPAKNKTTDVIEKGEVVVPRKPALIKYSWESFFPGNDGSYVNEGAREPEYYIKRIKKAWKNKKKMRLIITRSDLYDTNMQCLISNFKTKEKGGEMYDIYYSIELTEYRNYAPEIVTIIQTPTQQQPQAQVTEEPQREVETPVLRVGASVIANGPYCYDSYGGKPHGTANNLQTTVTRIVNGNPYPIHVGQYGWMQESQLQIVG